MSNSAFTPTTTEVTTEVPVNVPVVTAPQTYTPSNTQGFGAPGISSSFVQWRRVGNFMGISGRFTTGTTTASQAQFSIPSGYTIGQFAGQSGIQAVGSWIQSNGGSNSVKSGVVTATPGTNYLTFSSSDYATTINPVTAQTGTALFFSSNVTEFVGEILIPIAEWTSGTTTLADRAVEEYAFSTSTGSGTDATSFGYGVSGQAFGQNYASRSLRCRFTTPILSTDQLVLEVQESAGTPWQPLTSHNNALDVVPFTYQQPTSYGLGYLRKVTGSTTDIDVNFGAFARPGATYGSSGIAWTLVPATASWRLRKVSGGAQVGFPVSARNIVGDTSGTAVPTGMIGEVINGAAVASSVTIGTSSTAVSSIALTPGRWALKYNLSSYVATGATSGNRTYVYFRIRDSADTTTVPLSTKILLCKTVNNVVNDIYSNLAAEVIVDISQNTTYLLRGLRVDTNGTGVATAENDGNATTSNFYAIRIG